MAFSAVKIIVRTPQSRKGTTLTRIGRLEQHGAGASGLALSLQNLGAGNGPAALEGILKQNS
jgi:translation initiation factor 1 (eIF-1/SUI1)